MLLFYKMHKEYVIFIILTLLLIISIIVTYALKRYRYRILFMRVAYLSMIIISILIIHNIYSMLIFPFTVSPGGKISTCEAYSRSMLKHIVLAINNYKEFNGVYPGADRVGLINDKNAFVNIISNNNGDLNMYVYIEKNEKGNNKIFLSGHNRPVYYTYPASGNKGPDNLYHNNVEYYLWTWGYKEQYYCGIMKYFPSGPPNASWSINNWE